ncbi:hypothetical protein WUBG_11591 [Wuchereria bancrofti]|uniref:Uncharacterized protein n=1 Tax=Wuchereria bancrofti TaxID=6293 RepID=J9EQE9_WUCBA|nr:hypothetical protein WUBG_11591 [Wuchereria bancrofti]
MADELLMTGSLKDDVVDWDRIDTSSRVFKIAIQGKRDEFRSFHFSHCCSKYSSLYRWFPTSSYHSLLSLLPDFCTSNLYYNDIPIAFPGITLYPSLRAVQEMI